MLSVSPSSEQRWLWVRREFIALLWRRASARNVSQHTLYGIQQSTSTLRWYVVQNRFRCIILLETSQFRELLPFKSLRNFCLWFWFSGLVPQHSTRAPAQFHGSFRLPMLCASISAFNSSSNHLSPLPCRQLEKRIVHNARALTKIVCRLVPVVDPVPKYKARSLYHA